MFRSDRIHLRVTPEEKTALEKLAAQARMSLSRYLVETALRPLSARLRRR